MATKVKAKDIINVKYINQENHFVEENKNL